MARMSSDSEEEGYRTGAITVASDRGIQATLTHRDNQDMAEAGKRQQFNRNFGFLSMLGFTTTMMCTWEAIFFVNSSALYNGGPAGLLYGFIFCFFGSLAVCASLAEMASMMPTSGGQYHWTAILAPPKHRVILSWMTGWMSVLGWQAVTASGCFLGGTIVQGLLVLNYPNYNYERYHGTLLFFAVLALCVTVNTAGARFLPKIEGLILIIHILGFFAILIPMVYLAPQSSPSFVFTEFDTLGGWDNKGVSWFVGLLSGIYPFIGYDGPAHMAEEIQDASIIVPRCMLFTILINGILGLATIIAFLFCIGDLQTALNTSTGYDFIQVFHNATQSNAGTTAMTAILVAMAIFATIGLLATASRQTWAFARDRGLPYSDFLAKVDKRSALPLRAIALSTLLNALLALINIGSTTAFNAIVSLTIAGLFSSYLIPIVLLLNKRLKGQHVKYGPWRLGKMGTPVNVVAVGFLIIALIFSFFPPFLPITPGNFNWSSLVFVVVMAIGGVFFWGWGRTRYDGPVVERGVGVTETK